ncbi:GIY-YIG nuclease family protein [Comamonas sp.]|uniref:GIY-YIG nuclease family protein n=1 Tax=Comamonas sp. TaxID=34028 RepID=UPI0012C7EC1C|nr:GIY-YIG nuclease family protein [Comamonas sp.]MPS94717.1 GIY-YIG nuclease family protein [Comamonas sp.]
MTSSLPAQARRALARDYKQAFPAMGIYAVRCDAADLLHLGASRNVDATLNRLRFELSNGSRRDGALARAWARHGAQAFRFDVVDRVKERDDPLFDYDAELQSLLLLWQQELQGKRS